MLGDNQWDTFLGPYPISGSDGFPAIDFTGTDPSHPPGVALGTSAVAGQSSLVWTFQSVVGVGTPGHDVYGSVHLEAPYSGTVNLLRGVALSNANITLGTTDGGGFVLNGASTVTDDSTLTAYGGRYHHDPFVLNGSMSVSNNSVANYANATLQGPGTVHIGSGSTVDMKTVLAGLHVDVDRGGRLSLLYPNSAGTINEAAGGYVLIGGATTAASEVFHQASGTLDLLDKSGVQVASVQFAPGSHEYNSTLPIHGGLLEITTNPTMPGNLPTTFIH